jgi:hypothetical protein
MTNIDSISLATVVGGASPTTSTSSTGSTISKLGSDALQGCLSSISSAKATPGKAPNFAQIGLSCVQGAGSSLFKGIGGLFGSSSSK